jgi:hypothetical protein
MAREMSIQSTFLSRVLNGQGNFSLEQGLQLSHFLAHSPLESEYFLFLLQFEKAGSHELKSYFKTKLEGIRNERFRLSHHLERKQSLDEHEQAIYFSSWKYAFVHALCSLPQIRTEKDLVAPSGLPPDEVGTILKFLFSKGLVGIQNEQLQVNTLNLHLSDTSPFIDQHHRNWRYMVIKSLDNKKQNNLHYSSLITISAQDATRVREKLVQFIRELSTIVENTKVEKGFVFCLDFFDVQ